MGRGAPFGTLIYHIPSSRCYDNSSTARAEIVKSAITPARDRCQCPVRKWMKDLLRSDMLLLPLLLLLLILSITDVYGMTVRGNDAEHFLAGPFSLVQRLEARVHMRK